MAVRAGTDPISHRYWYRWPISARGPRDHRSQHETTNVSAIERSIKANPSRDGDAKPGISAHRETARLPKPGRTLASSEREIREDDPGAAVVGPHDAGCDGAHHWRRHAVAVMKNILQSTHLRLLLTLTSLASLAFVIEAGHRW